MSETSRMPARVYAYRFPTLGAQRQPHDARDEQQGFEQGFADGMAAGRQQGEQQGREQGQRLGYEQGYAEGLAAGQQAGLQQARERIDSALQPLQGLQQELQAWLQQQRAAQQQQLAALVQELAQQVLLRELALQPQQITALVEEALAQLPAAAEEIALFISASDAVQLAALSITECAGWPLRVDPALGVGECRVEACHGVVESRLGERLDGLLQPVLQTMTADAEHE